MREQGGTRHPRHHPVSALCSGGAMIAKNSRTKRSPLVCQQTGMTQMTFLSYDAAIDVSNQTKCLNWANVTTP